MYGYSNCTILKPAVKLNNQLLITNYEAEMKVTQAVFLEILQLGQDNRKLVKVSTRQFLLLF